MALLFPSPALGLPPLIASLAASAALVYGAHAAPFSRPRNVVGGHLVSGFAGSAVRFLLPLSLLPPPFDYVAACGLSVSLSVFLMLRTDTMHPPAAATGLIAGALGGEAVAAMGWLFAVQGAAGPAAVLVGTGWAWNRAVGTWLAARGTAAGWTSYPVGGNLAPSPFHRTVRSRTLDRPLNPAHDIMSTASAAASLKERLTELSSTEEGRKQLEEIAEKKLKQGLGNLKETLQAAQVSK
ncbi:HPP family-domain-containing protein [Hyaloraphidium curvatum]|nr:HPP family-domain-containing protein [Hyaloraphidium curvatum]